MAGSRVAVLEHKLAQPPTDALAAIRSMFTHPDDNTPGKLAYALEYRARQHR
ncbi:hypothetical protein [Nocardia nepalensis]|uniref:hypothetical protein n=1 Tax=Nocardia nepalensis TaxID=3375448 RepID=UPI003B6738D3